MAPTARVVLTEVDSLLSYLIDREVAVFINPVVDLGGVVTWRSPVRARGKFLTQRGKYSVESYRTWLDNVQYSALLFDGSLLQITYVFVAGALVSHRLAYVPCPFDVDIELLRTDSPSDVLDLYEGNGVRNVMLRGVIRFDYDERAASTNHPATHLTLNEVTECRVACWSPLRLGTFVEFVFKNFYPAVWDSHAYLSRVPKGPLADRTVTDDEMVGVHLAWQR